MNNRFFIIFSIVFILLNISCSKYKENEISIWIPPYHGIDKIADLYEKKTGIKINIKDVNFFDLRSSFVLSVEEGGGPDIVLGVNDWIGEYVEKDIIISLNKYYSKKEFFNNNFKSTFDGVSLNDNIYGIPARIENLILFYNKKFIKNPPKTDKQLIKMSKYLMKKEKFNYGIIVGTLDAYHVVPFIFGFGGYIFDKNMKPGINTKYTANALTFLADLQFKHKIMPGFTRNDTMLTAFLEEKTPMIVTGPWNLQNLLKSQKKYNIKFDLAVLPKITSTGKYLQPFIGIKSYVVSKNCKKPKKAVDFIKFITSAEISKKLVDQTLFLPANKHTYKKSFGDNQFIIDKFKDQISNGVAMPCYRELMFYWGSLTSVMHKTFKDPKSVKKILESEQSLLEGYLLEYYKENKIKK